MKTNGSTANRDERNLQRCADMVSANTLDSGLASFRSLARRILASPKAGWDSRKQRMFVKSLEAIERGCENDERWAVQMALALTIGNLRDFVESDVSAPPGGFEVIVKETQIREITQRVTHPHQESGMALPPA